MNIDEKVNLFNRWEAVIDREDKITVATQDDGLQYVKWSMRYVYVDIVALYTRNGQKVLCAVGKLRITRNRARKVLAPYGVTIDNKGVFYQDGTPIAEDILYFDTNKNRAINVYGKPYTVAREEACKLLYGEKR